MHSLAAVAVGEEMTEEVRDSVSFPCLIALRAVGGGWSSSWLGFNLGDIKSGGWETVRKNQLSPNCDGDKALTLYLT